MIWTLVVILLILWLFGFVGGPRMGLYTGSAPYWIHALIVVILILVILKLLGVLRL